MKQLPSFLSILILLGLMILPPKGWTDEFVVYSTRSEQLLKPLLEAYTNETDIKIDLITDKPKPWNGERSRSAQGLRKEP